MTNNPHLSKFLSDPFYYSGNQPPGVHQWLSTDKRRQFKYNVKHRRETMKAAGWLNAPLFNYNINKHGFRGSWDEDVVVSKSMIALGCSVTLGVGLPEEQTWPAILSMDQSMPVYNLGMPGAGLEAAYRVASYWVPLIKPEYVCVLSPEIHRREIWDSVKQKWSKIGSWNVNDSPLHRRLMSNEECLIASSRAVYSLNNLCARHSVKLILLYRSKVSIAKIKSMLARDLYHPGHIIMQQFAQEFSDAILHQQYFKEFSFGLAGG